MKTSISRHIRRSLAELRSNASGNTALLMAAGMPALIGGAGLAVDTAQWYMWKREMQYAVDQAAIAGAWSKVAGSTGTVYQTRATQELNANIQAADFHGTPTIALANYAGGTNNSVTVALSGTKRLPFSSFLTSKSVRVAVTAQAVFEAARTFTSCLIAVDPDTKGAITIGGSAYVVANCGAAALSNNAEAVTQNGDGSVFQVGWIVSAGGIDDDFGDDGNQIFENQTGLVDPFASLNTPAGNGITRTYGCSSDTVYMATYDETTTNSTNTYEGATSGSLTLASTVVNSSGTETKTKSVSSDAKKGDTSSTTTTLTSGSETTFSKSVTTGTGKSAVTTTSTWYRRIDTVQVVSSVITKINTTSGPEVANMQPGNYTSFEVSCDTNMAKGIYIIDGGEFRTNASYNLIGDGVMIVLKNGANFRINGTSTTYLKAMTTTEMVTYGPMTEAQAIKMKDMLIFEDRDSEGDESRVNGTSGNTLDGTIYLPKSTVVFNGNAGVVERCLIIASKRIVIEGDTNMTTFCPVPPGGGTAGVNVGGGPTSVRLVA